MTVTLPADIARTQLGSVLKRVVARRARFIITKSGKPTAVVLSVDDYDDMLEELDSNFRKTLAVSARQHQVGKNTILGEYLKKRKAAPGRRR